MYELTTGEYKVVFELYFLSASIDHSSVDISSTSSVETISRVSFVGKAGGVTMNPIVLGIIAGSGLIMKTYCKMKDFKRKRSNYNPGKNIRCDPANPTWDPRCVPLGIPPFLGGIPSDPTWDYGTSFMGSHQLKLGSCHRFLIASHLGNHIPGRIKPKIPPIPPGILPQISHSFPPGKSYPRKAVGLWKSYILNLSLKMKTFTPRDRV
ncbi:hypothetical protein pdam_00010280 [Pocillopora damicornis]|uniref:Uncharacterized protein n=1 Tax=Pocillopora damicornis TaxID=46731 RepID=A0A3M6TMU8_POCDA|nr:hypothetical protein pdam_00010280 [Pocillopora damicornis]